VRVNGILLVSLYCDACSLVSRLVTWARCLPVATYTEELRHLH